MRRSLALALLCALPLLLHAQPPPPPLLPPSPPLPPAPFPPPSPPPSPPPAIGARQLALHAAVGGADSGVSRVQLRGRGLARSRLRASARSVSCQTTARRCSSVARSGTARSARTCGSTAQVVPRSVAWCTRSPPDSRCVRSAQPVGVPVRQHRHDVAAGAHGAQRELRRRPTVGAWRQERGRRAAGGRVGV